MTSHSAFGSALQSSARLVAPLFAAFALAAPTVSFAQQPLLPPPPPTVSTIPSNGDVNPYGTAFVPTTFTNQSVVLKFGDLLVSNYNNNNNLQGTGTTIIRVDDRNRVSTFYTSKVTGLSGALAVLSNGDVIVGNVPTTDGTPNTLSAGELQIINPTGLLTGTVNNKAIIDGPWGMTVYETGTTAYVFVSNVLNGTITRLKFAESGFNLSLVSSTVIAAGLHHRTDPAAIVLGPSGLAYDSVSGILYMANSDDNAIYKFSNALTTGTDQANPVLVVQDTLHMHGPLDLAFAYNGDIMVANSDGSNVNPERPSTIIEYNTSGGFIAQFSVDPNNGGAFGIATQQRTDAVRFAAVDDNASSVTLWSKFVD
jgi:hypothetical protein